MPKETILFTPYDGEVDREWRYAFEPERLGAPALDCEPVIRGPIYSQDEVATAIKHLDKLHLQFCDAVFPILNEIHGVQLSNRYWMTLTGYFFYAYLHIMYDRRLRFKRVQNQLGEFNVVGMSKKDWCPTLTPFGFFFGSRQNEQNNRLLYSIIADAHDIPIEPVQAEVKNWNHEEEQLPPRTDRLNRLLDRGYQSDICLHSSMLGRKNLLSLMLRSGMKVGEIRLTGNYVEPSETNFGFRKAFRRFHSPDAFIQFAVQALEHLLPVAYAEQFAKLRTDAKAKLARNQPSIIVAGMGLLTDVQFSFWSADAAASGTLLAGLQHGGNYGELQELPGELVETHINDYYLTWGETGKAKELCIGALRFMHEQLPNVEKKVGILWVTTHDTRFGHFFCNCVQSLRMPEYFAFQQRFLEILPEILTKRMAVRLYPQELGWQLKEHWHKTAIDASSMNDIGFKQALAGAKLVLLDTVGSTTVYQCLHHDLPFVIIADPSLFLLNERAQRLYKLLEDVGVLHWDIEHGVDSLKDASENPERWWQEQARQKAVNEFRQEFYGEPSVGRIWKQLRELRKNHPETKNLTKVLAISERPALEGTKK